MVTSQAGRMYETLEDGDGLATETGRRTRAQGAGVERAAQRRALAFWAVRRQRGVLARLASWLCHTAEKQS